MSKEAEAKLNEFKESVKKDAEKIVTHIFPRKVIELNELVESEKFQLARLSKIYQKLNIPVPEPVLLNNDATSSKTNSKKRKLENDVDDIIGTKVFTLPGGAVTTNTHLVELVDLVKPLIHELIDFTNKIKMWITYQVPRIEDGNNFGVSVQEESIGEARQVEAEAATYLDQLTRYFITRAKIIAKVAKYPHVDDYRRVVLELDEKEFINLRLVVCELRNHYSSLHDIIIKNLEKIKKPRSVNTDNLY